MSLAIKRGSDFIKAWISTGFASCSAVSWFAFFLSSTLATPLFCETIEELPCAITNPSPEVFGKPDSPREAASAIVTGVQSTAGCIAGGEQSVSRNSARCYLLSLRLPPEQRLCECHMYRAPESGEHLMPPDSWLGFRVQAQSSAQAVATRNPKQYAEVTGTIMASLHLGVNANKASQNHNKRQKQAEAKSLAKAGARGKSKSWRQ